MALIRYDKTVMLFLLFIFIFSFNKSILGQTHENSLWKTFLESSFATHTLGSAEYCIFCNYPFTGLDIDDIKKHLSKHSNDETLPLKSITKIIAWFGIPIGPRKSKLRNISNNINALLTISDLIEMISNRHKLLNETQVKYKLKYTIKIKHLAPFSTLMNPGGHFWYVYPKGSRVRVVPGRYKRGYKAFQKKPFFAQRDVADDVNYMDAPVYENQILVPCTVYREEWFFVPDTKIQLWLPLHILEKDD